MITGERLQDDRETDTFRCAYCIALTAHDTLLGYRQAKVAKNLIGLFFIARKLDGDVARAARCRGLYALLVFAVAELHQAVAIQANPGNAAFLSRVDKRRSTRAQGT